MNWQVSVPSRLLRVGLVVLLATAIGIGRAAPASAAITASFAAATLTVTGDSLDNVITVSRNGVGTILVNGGAVVVSGGTPTIANTALIVVNGLDGNDTILLDEANGALPAANLVGGNGNDTLTGGSGADQISGDAGNDALFGKGGGDVLRGGADVITVHNLAGSDLTLVNLALDVAGGAPDGAADMVIVNATNGPDAILVAGSVAAGVQVTGLAAKVSVTTPEPALDFLVLNCLDGADVVSTAGLFPNTVLQGYNACETQLTSNVVDLATSVFDLPDPATEGGQLTYLVRAANAGPGIAEDLQLSDSLGGAALPAAGTRFFAVSPSSGGSCSAPPVNAAGGVVQCGWTGTTGPGVTRTMTITVNLQGSGILTNSASVGSLTPDSVPGNNQVDVTTNVSAVPTPTPTATATQSSTATPTSTPSATPPAGGRLGIPGVFTRFQPDW